MKYKIVIIQKKYDVFNIIIIYNKKYKTFISFVLRSMLWLNFICSRINIVLLFAKVTTLSHCLLPRISKKNVVVYICFLHMRL